MNRSKWVVVAIIAVGLFTSILARWYVTSGSGPDALASIECATMQPTIAELQGARMTIDNDTICAVLRELAVATPVADGFEEHASDPWHYIGRMRVQPERDAWFLVFVARRSTGFRPELSLRHRRGAGWAIVGHYDATAALAHLGLLDRIDRAKLESPGSLAPRDQGQPL
jgi:hypothetical protein